MVSEYFSMPNRYLFLCLHFTYLAELSFEPLVADTLGHILGGRCIAGYRNADSSILADIVRTWVLISNELDVTKCSCVIWRAVAELSVVYCLTTPSIYAGTHTVTHHVITQFGFAFSSSVSFTQASTFPIVADSFATISAIYCQAFVRLALSAAVHAVQTPTLGLSGFKVTSAVMEALESIAGFLFNTGRA